LPLRVFPLAGPGWLAHTLQVPRGRVSGRSVVAGGIAASLLAVAAGLRWPVVQLQMSSSDSAVAVLDGLVGLSLTLTGCHLLTCTRQRCNGGLLAAAGGLWLLTSVRWELGPSVFVQWLLVPGPIAIVAVVLLRYPDARSSRRSLGRFAALLVGWLLVGRLVNALLWDPAWGGSFGIWWPTLLRDPQAYTTAA